MLISIILESLILIGVIIIIAKLFWKNEYYDYINAIGPKPNNYHGCPYCQQFMMQNAGMDKLSLMHGSCPFCEYRKKHH